MYEVGLHSINDGEFLGVNRRSDDLLHISFRWATSGRRLGELQLMENSTLLDVQWKLRKFLQGSGSLKLIKGAVLYSEAW